MTSEHYSDSSSDFSGGARRDIWWMMKPTSYELPSGRLRHVYNAQDQPGPWRFTIVGFEGGDPNAFTASGLPKGLELVNGNRLFGVPQEIGSFHIKITYSGPSENGYFEATKYYGIEIMDPVRAGRDTLPVGRVGKAYESLLSAYGGAKPYTFTTKAGTLPSGLELSKSGDLFGTPSEAGRFTFTARVTDRDGYSDDQEYALEIAEGGLRIFFSETAQLYCQEKGTIKFSVRNLSDVDVSDVSFSADTSSVSGVKIFSLDALQHVAIHAGADKELSFSIEPTSLGEYILPVKFSLLDNSGMTLTQQGYPSINVIQRPVDVEIQSGDHYRLQADEANEIVISIHNNSNFDIFGANLLMEKISEEIDLSFVDSTENLALSHHSRYSVKAVAHARLEGRYRCTLRLDFPDKYDSRGIRTKDIEFICGRRDIKLRIDAPEEVEIGINQTKNVSVNITNLSGFDLKDAIVQATPAHNAIAKPEEAKIHVPAGATVTHDIPIHPLSQGRDQLDICIIAPNANVTIEEGTAIYLNIFVTPTRESGIVANYRFNGSWRKEWNKEEFIYSFGISLVSSELPVNKWIVSFYLPEKAYINPTSLSSNSNWVRLNEERSTDGFVYLESVEGNVIQPDKVIFLDLQIVYPDEQKKHEILTGVTLTQIT